MCEKLEKETKDYSNFNFQLCLDSGGRDDLVRAFNKMIKNGVKEVDEKMQYSRFINALKKASISINRKMLSEIAIADFKL